MGTDLKTIIKFMQIILVIKSEPFFTFPMTFTLIDCTGCCCSLAISCDPLSDIHTLWAQTLKVKFSDSIKRKTESLSFHESYQRSENMRALGELIVVQNERTVNL